MSTTTDSSKTVATEVSALPPAHVALNLVNREYDATVVKLSVPRIEDKNNGYVDQLVNMELAIQVHPEDVEESEIRSALFSIETAGRGKATRATYGDKVALSPPKNLDGWRIEIFGLDDDGQWRELRGKKLLLIGFVPGTAGSGDVLVRVTGLDYLYGGMHVYPHSFTVRFIEHEETGKDEDDRQTSLDDFVSDDEGQE